ncbi:MAG: plasmid pRiA4b ORF-3 family protein [bacterium]|nr:plasmid pRiA4b ORF-3 family protein [bacterium]
MYRHIIPLMGEKGDIYQLKVTLEDTHIPIWRTVLISGDVTFADLHDAIQTAFGWTNSHLHHFIVSTPTMQRLYVQSERMPSDFAPASPELLMSEEKTKLKEFLPTMVQKCEYEYDFGDGWSHAVEFEKAVPREKGQQYPACIDGENAAPPDDCGGTGGYEDLCKTLADPKSEDYEDMLEWLGLAKGSEFDPHAFDLKSINRALKKTAIISAG